MANPNCLDPESDFAEIAEEIFRITISKTPRKGFQVVFIDEVALTGQTLMNFETLGQVNW